MAGIGSRLNPNFKHLEKLVVFEPRVLKAMTREIDKQFRKNEKALFASGGSTGGKGWPPVPPGSPYALRKKRWRKQRKQIERDGETYTVTGTKTMQLTGHGRKSLTSKSHPDHIATYFGRGTRARITVGTSAEHLAYHINTGANRLFNKRLPHRDTLQMTTAQEHGYVSVVARQMKIKGERIARQIGRMRRVQARTK